MGQNKPIKNILPFALAIASFVLLCAPLSLSADTPEKGDVESQPAAAKSEYAPQSQAVPERPVANSSSSSTAPDGTATENSGGTVYSGENIDDLMVVGKVLSVGQSRMNQELLRNTGMVSTQQQVRIKVLEGPMAGKEFDINHEMSDNPAFTIEVKPGQDVLVSVATDRDKQVEVSVADYYRAPVLYWLLGIFLVAFLAFGGKQGFKSLLGLVATVLLIGYILLPMSLKGFDPLWTAVGIGLTACATSILLVGGFSKKSLSAIVGTVGGVIIAGVAAELVINLAPLTGLSSEEAQILRGSVLIQEPPFYRGLLAAGMLIGALGVIMDVGISIASSVHEVSKADKNFTTSQLYVAGMNVGRDIMGTMTNTLILAYTGSALPLLLLATQIPTVKLINLDLFATEVASALSGSLGLVFTIPLTAIAAARLMAQKQE